MSPGFPLQILPDATALAEAAAAAIARRAALAVAARGRFAVALSGGATPRAFHARLADPGGPWRSGPLAVDWGRTAVWFGDERCVPPDHPDSNYRMARETLLDAVRPGAVHRIEGEAPPEEAAARYDAALRAVGGLLDLVLLGLGPDGHTASLFPGTAALEATGRLAVANWVPRLGAHRVTLTYEALAAAREVLFVVSGAEKAAALAAVLSPAPGAVPLPAARVRAAEGVLVLADRAAAGRSGG